MSLSRPSLGTLNHTFGVPEPPSELRNNPKYFIQEYIFYSAAIKNVSVLGHFGLFLDSDWDHRGLKCVILSPFWMGDRIMNGVGTGIN